MSFKAKLIPHCYFFVLIEPQASHSRTSSWGTESEVTLGEGGGGRSLLCAPTGRGRRQLTCQTTLGVVRLYSRVHVTELLVLNEPYEIRLGTANPLVVTSVKEICGVEVALTLKNSL